MPNRRAEGIHPVIRAGRRAGDPPLDPTRLQEVHLLTIPQVCRRCHVGEKTVWKWVNAGLVPLYILPTRNFRVADDDLRSFIRKHLHRPHPGK